MKLEELLKAKNARHHALEGLPEVVVPLMTNALVTLQWWQVMTPPFTDWTTDDVRSGMDRLRALRAAVEHDSSDLLKRHSKDDRFPAAMLHRIIQSHRLNDRERFATAVHDTCAALAAWRPRNARRLRKHSGGTKPTYHLDFLRRTLDSWQRAREAGISMKEWSKDYAPAAAETLGITISRMQEYKFCDQLVNTARKRLARKQVSRKRRG